MVVGLAVVAVRPTAVAGVSLPEVGAPGGIAAIGAVVAAIGLVAGLLTFLRFRAVEYLVTTEELYVKRGLFSRTVRYLRLGRVQDSGFSRSALQRLFGYGHVYVSTAGGGGVELVFRSVPDPAAVNGVVIEQLDRVRSRS